MKFAIVVSHTSLSFYSCSYYPKATSSVLHIHVNMGKDPREGKTIKNFRKIYRPGQNLKGRDFSSLHNKSKLSIYRAQSIFILVSRLMVSTFGSIGERAALLSGTLSETVDDVDIHQQLAGICL